MAEKTIPLTPAAAAANTTPATPPATAATPPAGAKPIEKDAAKPAEPTQGAKARQSLEQLIKANKDAAKATADLEKKKSEVAPLAEKAEKFESMLKRMHEDPKAFLEEYGIDRHAVAERLAMAEIEDVKANTVEGRVDAVKKELDDLKAKQKSEQEAVARGELAKRQAAYVDTLKTEVVDGAKYPFAARAVKKMGDGAAAYLWNVGLAIFNGKTKGMDAKARESAPEPTPAEVAAEVEKYYADLHATLSAPEEEKTEEPATKKTPEQLKKEAEERAKAKKLEASKPVGVIEKPKSTIADRKIAARLKSKSA